VAKLKSIVIAAAITLVSCVVARAQTAKIDLYADNNRASCEIADQGTALHTVYVFMTGNASATGVRFAAPKPACWIGATWVGDQIVPGGSAAIGNSQGDWSIAWSPCRPLPLLVGQINYFATGASSPCCDYLPQAPGNILTIFVWTDCSFEERPLTVGQKVVVNPSAACRCQSPLATEPSTWGRVKSLYR
jgi:hypothetical protein